MVRNFLAAVGRETRGMHEAAYLLAAFAFFSQLLALVRDRLFAGTFGASHTLDLYFAAFRIPDLLFATVASLLSLYALLPVLSRLEERHPGLGTAFLRDALRYFFAAMAVVCGVAFVFAPQILVLIAPGLASPSLTLMTRILLLQPILLGASNILANLTQLRHRFLLYSISPLLYNLGIIAGIVFLYPRLGVAGLAWGVVLGALLHVAVQAPFFFAEKAAPSLPWRESLRHLYEVLVLSVPRTLALAANQISLLVLTAFASLFSVGSVSVFMLGWNLSAVPLTIIGVSYSVAAFPTLSRLYAGGHSKEFAEHILGAFRHIIFWAVPATALIIVLRAQLVRVILGSGAFDWPATRLVAAALALLILSLVAQSVSLLIARAYYAAGNSRKPFMFGLVDLVVSVASAVLLVALFHASPFARHFVEALLRVADVTGSTVLMLALALALGSIAEFVVGYRVFVRDFKLETRGLSRLAFESTSAGILGGALAYAALATMSLYVDINTASGVVAQGFVGGVVGLVGCVLVLLVLKNKEIKEVWAALAKRVKDIPPTALEPTDVSS